MVEGSYAVNKRERTTNGAQRQQDNERRGIRARHIEGNGSEFHRATFYRGDMELK